MRCRVAHLSDNGFLDFCLGRPLLINDHPRHDHCSDVGGQELQV